MGAQSGTCASLSHSFKVSPFSRVTSVQGVPTTPGGLSPSPPRPYTVSMLNAPFFPHMVIMSSSLSHSSTVTEASAQLIGRSTLCQQGPAAEYADASLLL
ncbi:hypothetical protein KUCAC02_008968 [Chaenocephalus aceratus]|uniref:Uncharacterized protein n=1 Tax=Chaenocephalus aceratus TaxID=36190 RepID=A0ACB9WSV6_CHAAC|nr:hypothetical protein KUCAC02_008968 [Chaenocephalus aceratus]